MKNSHKVEQNSHETEKFLQSQHQAKEVNLIPPDGGWGWVVCAGCFVIMILLTSQASVFSILFSSVFIEYETSSTTIGWMFNINNFVWHLVGIIASPLSESYGWRPIAIFGSIIGSISIIILTFTCTPISIFILYSVISGAGTGFVMTPAMICVPSYFDKYIGLSTAIWTSGISVGQFLMPILVTYLLSTYGFRGTILIYGGLLLNVCAAAAVFHPLEWHAIKPKTKSDPESKPEPTRRESIPLHVQSTFLRTSTYPEMRKDIFHSQCSLVLPYTKPTTGGASGSKEEESEKKVKILTTLNEILLMTIDHLKVMKNIRAIIMSWGFASMLSGYINFLMMVPFAIQDIGFNLNQAALIVSMAATSGVVTRLITLILSDRTWFNKKLCYMSGCLISAICTALFACLSNYYHLLVCIIFWGGGIGMNVSLYTLVVIEYMGMDLFPKVFGSTCLTIAALIITVGPLVGLIRDMTQSYSISIGVLAFFQLIPFLGWLFMPLAEKFDLRNQKNIKGEIKENTTETETKDC